jgi:hypothetical protein
MFFYKLKFKKKMYLSASKSHSTNAETRNPQITRVKKIMARKSHLMMKLRTKKKKVVKKKKVAKKMHNLKITSKL